MRYIDRVDELRQFVLELANERLLALDTEFIREQSYQPRVELVQVATQDGCIALIDYGRIGRLADDPLNPLLQDPAILKIFHAAEQDLEMLHQLTGFVPEPIWDTQLVMGLIGHRGRNGYAAVVEALLGVKPTKGETLTDWSRRPLSVEQLNYAVEDVRHLIPLYERQVDVLQSLERLLWAQEECHRARLAVIRALDTRSNPATLYRRVRGASSLDARGLAILRELSVWREQEAKRRDRPRGSVLKDDMLVEIGRRAPTHPRALNSLRGLSARDLERHASDWVACVQRVNQMTVAQYPAVEASGPVLSEAEQALAALLQAVLHHIAERERLQPGLIATTADLHRLIEGHRADDLDHPLLSGWRYHVVGSVLKAVMNGQYHVYWEPSQARLAMDRRTVATDGQHGGRSVQVTTGHGHHPTS